ncbi:lobe protein isoform X1 [Nasonia vitripennis]|uniref:Uncharacterized protein n=1 Tax=Nasonia vitripennis TaxID=7425 RepID=A0A7M7T6N6_NASVI|nr:lobe protein isoform X1 [Nasonia vitripennis]XP_008208815.1 lobe protein isoform X1 [Nasonia vitripennis]XP_008208816.1 lobe protein isoform X1 [Nasonia vitripennis]XP_016845475.1 lobe protein isoform X1 [Nasonia vitripennis]XP_031778135.1 lobe protein isoform X1 [Nasonia vitripennis]XP_032458169.1 lobe protein isoform X1 [Nasonia vitripennis]XP_032458170.1 lobe protein isoform X1 [Nasonia vitripennis]
MYATCRCLNVSIKTKGNELQNVNIDTLELSASEHADVFFNNNLATTNELEKITKEQPGLVEVRNVGAWAIHRCYNCFMFTHAVHREYGAASVLINTNVITSDDEIAQLKASPNYSPVFRIVIDHSKIDNLDSLQPLTKYSVSQLSSTLRLALGGLEQQLEEAIQRQALLVDERIRAFTQEQYQILEEFRERAHNEHALLARLIYSEQQNIVGSTNLETPPATPETVQPSKPTSENDAVDATVQFDSGNPVLREHSPSKSNKAVHAINGIHNNETRTRKLSNYDGEALFMLEGMDDTPLPIRQLQASDQESDTDDSGNEGMHIPRSQRSGHPTLAKSLPVTVPTFNTFSQRLMQDDDDEQISRNPIDPHNIQASIKALAKSVHGDTVFGDLPRPRFSTQI